MNRSAIPRRVLVQYLDKGIAARLKHALEGPKSVLQQLGDPNP